MNYCITLEFEWDEAKSARTYAERGFDFAYVAHAFFDEHKMIKPDVRHSYGEDRFQLLGTIQGRIFVLVYTIRNDVIRIISARKANQREVSRYENHKNAH